MVSISVGDLVGSAEITIMVDSPSISPKITQYVEFQSGASKFIDAGALIQNLPGDTIVDYECEAIQSYYVNSWDMDFSLHSFPCASDVFEIHTGNQILIRDS